MTKKHPLIRTYSRDGRRALNELYDCYDELKKLGWRHRMVSTQYEKPLNKPIVQLPIYAYLTPTKKTKASESSLWILGGIHGEEPAGPNALAKCIDTVVRLANEGISIVFMPMLNPIGYIHDHRYFNSHRGNGLSVTDSEHLLRQNQGSNKSKKARASNPYASEILKYMVRFAKHHPPMLVVDHHEDEIEKNSKRIDAHVSYSYAYGKPPIIKPLCPKITSILIKSGFPVQEEGLTRFGEEIHSGFVINSSDGSVDELLASLGAKAVFVIETTRDNVKDIPLNDRVEAHMKVIKSYRRLWKKVLNS